MQDTCAKEKVECIYALDESMQRTRNLAHKAPITMPSSMTSLLSQAAQSAPTQPTQPTQTGQPTQAGQVAAAKTTAPWAMEEEATRAAFAHSQPCNFFDPHAAEVHMLGLYQPYRKAASELAEGLSADATRHDYATRLQEFFHFVEQQKLTKSGIV